MFNVKRHRCLAALALGLLILLSQLAAMPAAANVVVTFLDVGQGDAVHITTGHGVNILIDGGVQQAGRDTVLPYLQSQGITELDLVVATHPHADHIGGLIPVLENLQVREVLADGQIHTTRTYERFLLTIDSLDIPFTVAEAGMEYAFGGLDSFRVLHPQKEHLPGLNNNSVVIMLAAEGTRVLLTGDIEREAEAVLAAQGGLAADILKVAHHGSASSSTTAFMEAASPTVAIIMAGVDNPYNHPHREALVRLSRAQIYRTDQHGTITVTLEDGAYSVETAGRSHTDEHRVNLSTAGQAELEALPGIGPVLAQRIIEFRQAEGLHSTSDVLDVSGIGPKTFASIKDLIYVEE